MIPGEQAITFRLPSALKRRVEAAAFNSGQTLQAFLLQAARAATEEVEGRPGARPPAGPAKARRRDQDLAYLALLCKKARCGGPGFRGVGRECARKLHRLIESLEHPARARRLLGQHLRALLAASGQLRPDYDPLLTWLGNCFPQLMDQVSRRRRAEFAAGFWDAVRAGEAKGDFRGW
jgi:hypothetical protein